MTTIEHYRAQLEECERFTDQSTNRHDKIVWNKHYLDLIVTLQMKLRTPLTAPVLNGAREAMTRTV